jgi:hypothetical protein
VQVPSQLHLSPRLLCTVRALHWSRPGPLAPASVASSSLFRPNRSRSAGRINHMASTAHKTAAEYVEHYDDEETLQRKVRTGRNRRADREVDGVRFRDRLPLQEDATGGTMKCPSLRMKEMLRDRAELTLSCACCPCRLLCFCRFPF